MASRPETKEQAVTKAPATGLTAEMPEYLKSYQGPSGTENIDTADVNIPRLKLGQGLTPEVKEGLVKDGDMFHSITKQVLIPKGHQGIIIPVAYVKEFILWRDQNFEGGGIMARAQRVVEAGVVRYKWDNPNQEFKNKVKGVVAVTWRTKEYIDQDHLDDFGTAIPGDKTSGPAATAHYNYVVCMPEIDNTVVALSFSRTSAKKARDLNAMLKMGSAPMFARKFSIGAVPEKDDAGHDYFNYGIIPAGFVETQEMFNNLKSLYTSLSQQQFRVDFDTEANAETSRTEAEQQEF